jgi:hypothetical protein
MSLGPPSRIEIYFNLFYSILKVLIGADLETFLFRAGQPEQDQASLFGLDPDENVSTAPIVEGIGKGAQGVQDGLRVPALFKFQPFPFDQAAFEDFEDVDG